MSQTANKERFVSLLTSHQPQLMLYVRALVPNRTDADEILQEVNLYLWRHADELRAEDTFAAWLRQTARYQVLTYRKRLGRDRARFSDAMVDELANAFSELAGNADRRQTALADCLRKLSEKDRQTILLRYEVGTTTQALADRLGRSLKGLYESLARIRRQLFECVTRTITAEERH